MGNWTMKVKDSSGTYVSDGNIPIPMEDLETGRLATVQRVRLADGDTAFITPETKYSEEPFTMFFAIATSAFRTKIETYIENGDSVKITTHTSEVFTGKFTSMKRVWFTGIAPDEYDIMVTFTRE